MNVDNILKLYDELGEDATRMLNIGSDILSYGMRDQQKELDKNADILLRFREQIRFALVQDGLWKEEYNGR